MNENWVIEPLVGVKDLRLGMTYTQVVQVLGEPSQKRLNQPATVAYWPEGVAVHFNPDAEFIEIARGTAISPVLHGVDVFTTPADDLVRKMAESGHAFDPMTEKGHTFVFRHLQVGLWRSVVPEGVDDHEGRYFESVGIGKSGYYR